jgi:hypothetical protein
MHLVALVVNPTPESYDCPSVRMEQFAHLPPNQQEGLKNLMSLIGPDGVAHLASQGPRKLSFRLSRSVLASVDAMCAEVRSTCVQAAHCTSSTRLLRAESLPLSRCHLERL